MPCSGRVDAKLLAFCEVRDIVVFAWLHMAGLPPCAYEDLVKRHHKLQIVLQLPHREPLVVGWIAQDMKPNVQQIVGCAIDGKFECW